MATSRTRNLKLYLSSGLSVEAKANLEIIDRLGAVYYIDNTDSLNLRSTNDISLLPGDPSVGGSGGANLNLGSQATPIGNLNIWANTFTMRGTLKLGDKASGGSKAMTFQYKSDVSGTVDTTADRTLSVDLEGADRNLVLGGNFTLSSSATLAGNGFSVSLPANGVILIENASQVITNKTISATNNAISNIANTNIAAGAAIDTTKLATGEVDNTKFNYLKNVTSDLQAQLDSKQANGNYLTALSGDVVAAGPGSATATISANAISTSKVQDAAITDAKLAGSINRAKIAAGAANEILINSPSGSMTSEAVLAKSRGGSGQDNSMLNFPSSGTLITAFGNYTLTNKTIDAALNTLSNVPYSSLILTQSIIDGDVSPSANIAYSKLNLAGSISNTDIASNANISGSKIDTNFGNQLIRTTNGIEFSEGGFTTKLQGAQSGQTTNLTFDLPADYGTAGYVLTTDGAGDLIWTNPASGGTVTSVALSAPSQFSVSGSPITTNGTLGFSWLPQTANTVLAGPSSGIPASPTFRALTATDLPLHSHVAADVSDFSEAVDDRVSTLVQNSSSLTWAYDDTLNTLTATVSLSPFSTSNLSEGTNLYFTNTRVYNKNKVSLVGGTGISITNADGPETSTFALDFAEFTTDSLTEGTTNLFHTAERVQDVVGAMSIDSAEILRTYNDGGNTISWALATTGVLANTYGSATQVPVFTVDSKGRISSVTDTSISIPSTAISDFQEAVQDVVGSTLVGQSNDIAPTYDDPGNGLTLSLRKEFISTKPSASVATDDILIFGDTSDSENLKKTTVAALLDLGGGSFAADWVTADGLSKTVTHNLNSRDVIIQVFDGVTYETITPDTVVRTSLNVVTLTSSEAPSTSWRVLIKRL